jgi:hypothetical protein
VGNFHTAGDIITQINGVDVKGLAPSDIFLLFSSVKEKKKYSLTISLTDTAALIASNEQGTTDEPHDNPNEEITVANADEPHENPNEEITVANATCNAECMIPNDQGTTDELSTKNETNDDSNPIILSEAKLKVGDFITYDSPTFCAGDPKGIQFTEVLETNPDEDIMIRLDNGDVLLKTEQIARVRQACKIDPFYRHIYEFHMEKSQKCPRKKSSEGI